MLRLEGIFVARDVRIAVLPFDQTQDSPMLTAQADFQDTRSVAYRLRLRRMQYFLELLEAVSRETAPQPVKLLDVGGSIKFWKVLGLANRDDIEFTILNIVTADEEDERFRYLKGDARDLSQFDDGQFDIVFSNSVIEHVGTWEDQQRMAREVRRVGRRYFVQTPNRYFPIEPHFLFPAFQFLPERVQVFLLMRFKLGWFPRAKTREDAIRYAREIRLLTRPEVQQLFPESRLISEKFHGLTKSFMAVCDR
jgi:SAM-dependent methyltransferase